MGTNDHPLRDIRDHNNLSIAALAKVTKLSTRTIIRAERGHSINPTSRQILCDFFTEVLGRQITSQQLGLIAHDSESLPETTLESEEMKRRELLRSALVIASSALTLPISLDIDRIVAVLSNPASLDAPTLLQLEAVINGLWHLSNNNQITEVERTLPIYLPQFVTLAHQPTKHQRRAAHLASQAYILSAEIDRGNAVAMKAYCQQAVLYSEIAENYDIQVAAMKQQATILLVDRKPLEALQAYQKALPLVHQVTPLLRSRVYLGLASACARCGQKQDALRYLGLAQENFPRHPEDDPNYLYTICDLPVLHLYEALTYTDLHQPGDAWNALMHVDGLHPKMSVPVSTRIEFVNLQARTAAELGNMELSRTYLLASVDAASDQGYNLWLAEAHDVYQEMLTIWPNEPQIQALGQLFHGEQA